MSDKENPHTESHKEPIEQVSATRTMPQYENMSFEKLITAFKKLLKREHIHQVKEDVTTVIEVFESKYLERLDKRKQEFLDAGGDEFEFSYVLPVKIEFDTLHDVYRKKLQKHYKELEKDLKKNYAERLDIIDKITNLINTKENINTTFKHFIELQKQWRSIGHIPKVHLDDTWKKYQHHVEKFYDYLNLNRALRDKDFAHNLKEKQKLVSKAKALAEEPDLQKALREMRFLRKVWRENTGPVVKEHRESIWEEFNEALDVIREKESLYAEDLEKIYKQNLECKETLLKKMKAIISESKDLTVSQRNSNAKKMKAIREEFLQIGKVPASENKNLWALFKSIGKSYASQQKIFFNKIKEEESTNLKKRKDIITQVEKIKDSEDFESTTPQIIHLQKEWKNIGRVSKKYSEKTWTQFREICDYYFSKCHTQRDEKILEQQKMSLDTKKELLESLKRYTPQDRASDISFIRNTLSKWTASGRVPSQEKNIDKNFDDVLDGLLKNIKITESDLEEIKYEIKLNKMGSQDSWRLNKERTVIEKNINSTASELHQLEQNASFIRGNPDNPLLVEIRNRTEELHKKLDSLKLKKKKLTILLRKINV